MGLLVENIRVSKEVSNCALVDINNVKYILINMNDRIEVYNSELILLKNLNFGMYTGIINTCIVDNKEYLIIVSIDGNYCILETKLIFDEKFNINKNMKPLNTKNKIGHRHNRNNFIYKSSIVIKNVFILFSKDGDIYCCTIKNECLIFDDFPNDFKYFKILSVSSDGVYLVFLANDTHENRVILKYNIENGKLKLRSRSSETDNGMKKIKQSNTPLEGVKNVDIFRNGYLSIGNNFICYEDGDIVRTELANTYIKSKCNIGSKMLYSMEDGELLQVEILNKKTNKTRNTQSVGDEIELQTEINPKKIMMTVIDKTPSGYNFMKAINKTTVLAGNHEVLELIRLDNTKIEVINKIECEGGIRNGMFNKGLYYLWNQNKIFNVSYSLIPTFKDISMMSEVIQKFMKIDDILILGHYNKGHIISSTNEHILDTERILNISKCTYKNRQIVYFNTPNHIYKVFNRNEIFNLKLENIILSSYKSDSAIFYLNDRRLVYVDLESMIVLFDMHVDYEISTILIAENILISTFDNKFMVGYEDFSIKCAVKAPTFVHSLCYENRSFFSDGKSIYEYRLTGFEILFDKIYESCTPINSLALIRSYLIVISKESVFINLKDLSKDKIKLQDITNALCEDRYYFTKGKKLISCDFENNSTYNWFLYKSLQIRGMRYSEIVRYFPDKQLTVLIDKLSKSTFLMIGDSEVGKIRDFYANNVIELEDDLIISGYTNDKQMVITISSHFKGEISDVKKSNQAYVLHTEENEVISVYDFTDGFIICNSNTIFLYNNRFIKTLVMEIDFTIDKVYSHSNCLLVIDYFRSFVLLKYTDKKTLDIAGSPTTTCKFDLGCLTDKHIILSSGSALYVYEIEGFKMISQTNFGCEIVYIESQSLNINAPGDIYIFTSNSSIHSLKIQ